MSAQIHSLTDGLNGFILWYVTVLISMLVGLRQGRASIAAFLASFFVTIPAMLVCWPVSSITGTLLEHLGMGKAGPLVLLNSLVSMVAVGYGAGRLIAHRSKTSDSTQYRRGAVVSHNLFARRRRVDRCDPSALVTLAGYPVAPQDETKHFKLIGTTGTGKSTAIRELLSGALERGDRAIIADPDGGYLDTFYDAARGDVILNPFAPGAARWNLFNEITNDYDVDQLARSLIPDSGDPDVIWCEYARTLFTALVQRAMSAGVKDDKEILRLVTDASLEDLRKMLKGTSAGPFLAEGNEKTFGCVRTVLSSGVRALKYTTRQEGTPFSVREWVRTGAARHAGGKGGVLFLPYQASEIAALRSMISAWLRIAIFEAMSKGEGDQRLWFAIDELDALGEIDGLKDALARMRKFGGRCVLGLQSIAQIPALYRKDAPTITENCGNTVILRCSASEHGGTADFASKLIGQREVTHITRSHTLRTPWSLIRPTTISESIRIEPAVMASEIERLADLEGFLKFASNPDWQRVTIPPSSGAAAARGKRPTATAPSSSPPTASPTVVPAPAPAAALSQPVGAAPLSPTARRPTKSTKRTPRKRTRKPRTQVTPPGPSSGEPNPTIR